MFVTQFCRLWDFRARSVQFQVLVNIYSVQRLHFISKSPNCRVGTFISRDCVVKGSNPTSFTSFERIFTIPRIHVRLPLACLWVLLFHSCALKCFKPGSSLSSVLFTANIVPNPQTRYPKVSHMGSEANVERATKKWAASERWPWHGEQASTYGALATARPNTSSRKLLPVTGNSRELNTLATLLVWAHQQEIFQTVQLLTIEVWKLAIDRKRNIAIRIQTVV